MAVDIGVFLTTWAPRLNLLLVAYVVYLFISLFRRKSDEHIYTTPWKLLFVAVSVYIVEQSLTVLRMLEIVSYPHLLVNGAFEIVIITLFIYTLLLHRYFTKRRGGATLLLKKLVLAGGRSGFVEVI